MNRAVALLEQYEIEVLRTRKGRGAILCDTQRGRLIFKEYTGRGGTTASAGAVLAPGGTGNCSQWRDYLPQREGCIGDRLWTHVRYF